MLYSYSDGYSDGEKYAPGELEEIDRLDSIRYQQEADAKIDLVNQFSALNEALENSHAALSSLVEQTALLVAMTNNLKLQLEIVLKNIKL